MAYDSEEEFLQSVSGGDSPGWEPESDYAPPKNDARLNTLTGQSGTQQFIDAAAYKQRRMTNSMKQAWYSLKGDDKAAADLQKIIDHEDKIYKNYMRSEFNPHRTAAAAGEMVGGVTHPVSMATLPLTGGGSVLGRAALQGLYSGAVEALTSPNKERAQAGALGVAGGAMGSALGDTVVKGVQGARGKWTDEVARKADELSRKYNLKPGIGQLREYSGKQLSPEQLRARGANWPYAVEKHATHNQDVDSKFMEEALGYSTDPTVSKAFPIEDAKQLTESLIKEAEVIWKPANKALVTSKHGVFSGDLWNSLQTLAKRNPEILTDKSAIPDKVVRDNLQKILEAPDWAHAPKFSAKEYSDIVSELGNASHRTKILSQGQTPAYDGKTVKRVTEAFDAAKKDMAGWGKKDPNAYSLWDTANTQYQEKIIPVRNNPILDASRTLDEKGNDLYKIMGEASDGTNYRHMRSLLNEYKDRGMNSAADRLDLIDANSLAANHGASGMSPVAVNPPKLDKNTGALSILGDSYTWAANRPFIKNMYFGDPAIPKGALSRTIRNLPTAIGRENSEPIAATSAALWDLFGLNSSDGSDNPAEQFSHGGMSPGAVTQHSDRP